MKSLIVIIITVIIVGLGAVVGLTFLFGRSSDKGTSGVPSSGVSLFGSRRGGTDGGVFVSEDSGTTWEQRVRFGLKSSLGSAEVNTIVFRPDDPTSVLLGTAGNGLFVSTSGSADWVRVEDVNNVLTADATIYEIAFDPASSTIMYLAVTQQNTGKVLKSTNGGRSFAEVYRTPKAPSAVFTVVVDPDKPSRVYIGTNEGGLFTSENGGASWSVVKWFDGGSVRKMYIHPQDANFMYLLTFGKGGTKIQRSYNHGATWEELKVSPPKGQRITGVYGLSFHPTDANVLYLATSAGVFKTPDAGATWQEFPLIIPPSLLPVFAVAVDPRNPQILYVAASSQIYKSKDGGASWEVRQLPTAKNIRVLAFSPDSSVVLWAGMRK